MEVGTEISQKIRSAIKAKLMELGAYVDDELPDYIMVMVANKKNKSQMKSDLSLFLGNNTDAFTTWLHGLLGKLQTLTVDSGNKAEKANTGKEKKKKEGKPGKGDSSKKIIKDKEKKKNRKRKSSHGSVDEILKAKVPAVSKGKDGTDANIEDSNIDNNSGLKQVASEPMKEVENESNREISKSIDVPEQVVQEEFEDVRQLLVAPTPGDDLARELDAVEEEVVISKSAEKKRDSSPVPTASKEIKSKASMPAVSSKVQHQEQNIKRKLPSSVVASVSRTRDEEEYDPFNPAVGSVASVVKVTSRKTNVPASMQANRTLLVKAMSEAEKSVSVQKKVAVTRPINRGISPAEYSPKRKLSTDFSHRESPPPYIPSKKARAEGTSSGESVARVRPKVLSRDDIRHSLGRDRDRRLISASRKQELLKAMGMDKVRRTTSSAHPSDSGSCTNSSIKSSVGPLAERVSYGREVRSDRDAGEVKNLQITARVGPMRSASRDDDKRIPSATLSESDRPVRFTVVTGQSKKKALASSDARARIATKSLASAVSRQVDTQASKKGRVAAVVPGSSRAGGRVLSKMARDAVQKQCQAAVLSVRKVAVANGSSSSSVIRETKETSPDSRVVYCESDSPLTVDNEQSLDGEDEDEDVCTRVEVNLVEDDDDGEDSVASETEIKHTEVEQENVEVSATAVKKSESLSELADVKEEVREMNEEKTAPESDVEDLSQMLEGEDLDSQLLLIEEELSRGVDDVEPVGDGDGLVVAAAGAQPTSDSKSGIRFIVTLDGVDESQFDDKTVGKPAPLVPKAPLQAVQTPLPAQPTPTFLGPSSITPLPVAPLPPSAPTQLPMTVPQPLPPSLPQAPLQSSSSQGPTRPRPPKIQPFSISLRDSDDEHEEKIVTYVQAGDVSAADISAGAAASEDEMSVLQQARQQERCKFWPACMAGAECQYHHPTTHCKTFPNCKFGDKCLFIHPNCRFDSKCARPDCPFTHTSKRRLQNVAVPAVRLPAVRQFPYYPIMPQPQQTSICHFFPNCLNPNCPFIHPKQCMYGAGCKNPSCAFYHPAIVPPVVSSIPVLDKAKLKWQAMPASQSKTSKPGPGTTTSTS